MIAIVLFAFVPLDLRDTVIRDRVDVIEINECFATEDDGTQRHCYWQVIFWHDHEEIGRHGKRRAFRVAHFVMNRREPKIIDGCMCWSDGAKRYKVEATAFSFTRTDVRDDPEILDRQHLSQEDRRGIFGVSGEK